MVLIAYFEMRRNSNNTPVEYCMSDEFIELLRRRARLYRSLMTPLSRKEMYAKSLVYMSEEASLAFEYYVRESALFEVCITPIFLFLVLITITVFLSQCFLGF
jgi:hypothetical protein